MIKKMSLLAAICLCSYLGFTQEVNLFIKDVKEERHLEQEDSFIELESIIKGIKIGELNQVKIKEITLAKDDKGNILERKESFFGDDYSDRNEVKIKLEAPTRNATSISLLEGTLKVFSPSQSNASKIIINQPLNNYNTNLLCKYYSDIKLTLIDKEAFEKLKEGDEEEYQKQIEKLKKDGGLKEGMAETIDAFKQFFDGLSGFGSGESVSFYVEDDDDKIDEIKLLNADGKKMNYGSSSGGNSLTINTKEKIAEDWKIEILIENDKSLKEYKFSLSNIILP